MYFHKHTYFESIVAFFTLCLKINKFWFLFTIYEVFSNSHESHWYQHFLLAISITIFQLSTFQIRIQALSNLSSCFLSIIFSLSSFLHFLHWFFINFSIQQLFSWRDLGKQYRYCNTWRVSKVDYVRYTNIAKLSPSQAQTKA